MVVNTLELCLQLDAQAAEQVRSIDQEFCLKRRSVYTKRRECTSAIPEFWSQALQQHPYILECMTGDDQEIMAYLQEVLGCRVAALSPPPPISARSYSSERACSQVVVDACPGAEDNPASFSISLTFDDNPFLFAQTLTKYFEHQRSLELFKVTASGVQWKPEHVGHHPCSLDFVLYGYLSSSIVEHTSFAKGLPCHPLLHM